MQFQRYTLFEGHTLAWRLFKRHHTHFNNIFWASRAASTYSFSATAGRAKSDKTGDVFPFAKNNRRVAADLGDWGSHYSDFDRWMRMASVLALTGYLETYIAQLTTSALESNPSLTFGGGPVIDGAAYLKRNSKYDFFPLSEQFTRGTWHQRGSAFSKYFGLDPFAAHASVLEKLRRVRNDAGHSFGRSIEGMSFPKSWIVEKLPSIDDQQMASFLFEIESTAKKIEKQIAPIVGQYEVIKCFHRWLPACKNANLGSKVLAKEFSVYFNGVSGTPYGKEPSLALISYYNSL